MPDAPPIRFHPIPSADVRALRAGAPDAYGLPPERHVSDGSGLPCRHCLRDVPAGAGYLLLAWRPFAGLNPYAETGPVILCAGDCPRAAPGPGLPPMLGAPAYLLRGYDAAERIVPGTGGVVATADIPATCAALLARPGVVHVDVRSASNTCFMVRVRAG